MGFTEGEKGVSEHDDGSESVHNFGLLSAPFISFGAELILPSLSVSVDSALYSHGIAGLSEELYCFYFRNFGVTHYDRLVIGELQPLAAFSCSSVAIAPWLTRKVLCLPAFLP